MQLFHYKHAFQNPYWWLSACNVLYFPTYSQYLQLECQSGFQGSFILRNNTCVDRKHFIPVTAPSELFGKDEYHLRKDDLWLPSLYLVIAWFHVACGQENIYYVTAIFREKNTSTRITLVIFLEIREMYKNMALEKYAGCQITSPFFWQTIVRN